MRGKEKGRRIEGEEEGRGGRRGRGGEVLLSVREAGKDDVIGLSGLGD